MTGDGPTGARPAARRAPAHRPLARQRRPDRRRTPRQAVERGIPEIAITDHVDFDPSAPGLRRHDVRPARADGPRGRRALGRSRRHDPVRRGDHVGPSLGGGHPRAPAPAIAYDFVIGSVHVYRASPYAAERVAAWVAGTLARGDRGAVLRRGREAAARSGLFDALGHIDFVKRYLCAARDGRGPRGRAGAVRADPPRPRRERDGPRGQHERPAPGRRRDLPVAARSSPAIASSVDAP